MIEFVEKMKEIDAIQTLIKQHYREQSTARYFFAAAAVASQDGKEDGLDDDANAMLVDSLLRKCGENIEALEHLLPQRERAPSLTITHATTASELHARGVLSFLYGRLGDTAELARLHRSRRLSALMQRSQRGASSHAGNMASSSSLSLHKSPSSLSAFPQVQQQQQQAEPSAAEEDEELVKENQLLLHSLATDVDVLKRIERQVAEISQLQHVLATKAVEQASDLDLLLTQAESVSAEVQQGNERVNTATSRGRLKCPPNLNTSVALLLLFLSVLLLMLNRLHR